MAQVNRHLRKIGIPRAFYYYFYPGLFEAFFEHLGYEVIVSAPSSKVTVALATDVCEAEHCLPNKLFDGHIASLADKVDAVFVPRLISLTKGHIACPRFGALPDATAAWLGEKTPVISFEINETRQPLQDSLVQLATTLGWKKRQGVDAARKAFDVYQQNKHNALTLHQQQLEKGRFLILGHPYTLHDDFVAGPVLRKLRKLKVPFEVMSFDQTLDGKGDILWCSFAKMFRTLEQLDGNDTAGVIQLTTFNCGADSMMMERFRRLCKRQNIPYMIVMVDEHTGQAGLETRIEAFVDSLAWKKHGRRAP